MEQVEVMYTIGSGMGHKARELIITPAQTP